jgi:hypothetical protein
MPNLEDSPSLLRTCPRSHNAAVLATSVMNAFVPYGDLIAVRGREHDISFRSGTMHWGRRYLLMATGRKSYQNGSGSRSGELLAMRSLANG